MAAPGTLEPQAHVKECKRGKPGAALVPGLESPSTALSGMCLVKHSLTPLLHQTLSPALLIQPRDILAAQAGSCRPGLCGLSALLSLSRGQHHRFKHMPLRLAQAHITERSTSTYSCRSKQKLSWALLLSPCPLAPPELPAAGCSFKDA